jgi:hypothetical protein
MRIIKTNNARDLPTAPRYREVVGEKIRIWRHYYWAPREHDAEIWVYPPPRAIEARCRWEQEWTFICDLEIKSTTAVTVVAILNGVPYETIRVIPIPARRYPRRRAGK